MKRSKHDPDGETIILQLMQLISAYKKAVNEQLREYTEEAKRTGKITITIIPLKPQDLVADARNILTSKIAKWLDRDVEQAEAMVYSQSLESLSAQDLDFYLQLLTLTMESWLGSANKVKIWAMIRGSDYHSQRAAQYTKNKQWTLAEAEYLKALQYDGENTSFSGGLVISLTNIGIVLHFQERDYEAREYFERSITAFERMKPEVILYEKAKEAYGLARSMV